GFFRPAPENALRGAGAQVVNFVPPLARGRYYPRRFQHVEVLRDRLTGQAQVMLHRQPGAYLEQRLSVALMQFVQDGPTRRCGECFKDIGHGTMIGKSLLACQGDYERICPLCPRPPDESPSAESGDVMAADR